MTPSCGLRVETALARAEQAARAGEELLQRGTELSESWEVAEVVCSASRCHHLLLARLSRYDHDISTD
jgi:hypothetical protein